MKCPSPSRLLGRVKAGIGKYRFKISGSVSDEKGMWRKLLGLYGPPVTSSTIEYSR